jgi:hypothetical protein
MGFNNLIGKKLEFSKKSETNLEVQYSTKPIKQTYELKDLIQKKVDLENELSILNTLISEASKLGVKETTEEI